MSKLFVVPLALALLAAPALAQEKAEPKKEETAVPKGLKSRIFEVKHRDPVQLADVIRSLGSGTGGAHLDVNREMRTLTARDFPENLAQMEEALGRLDVPAPAAADVDLRIHVLEAKKSELASGDLPADLKEAIAALRGTLAYKGYALLTSFTQRVSDDSRNVNGGGEVPLEGFGEAKKTAVLRMHWSVNAVRISRGDAGATTVKLHGFKFGAEGARLESDVTLREGEQVVVGTSVFRDRGLVLVVSAKRMK